MRFGRLARPRRQLRIGFGVLLAAASVTAVAGAPSDSAFATGFTVSALSEGGTANDLAQSLAGAGVSIANVSVTGSTTSLAAFTGGTSAFGAGGIDAGVALSSGNLGTENLLDGCPNSLLGPNDDVGATCAFGGEGDPQLDALLPVGQSSYDATALEFDVTPANDGLSFTFVFGSEEYNEFVGSGFNDVFGLFVNGNNCAFVPGTDGTPVSINNVNHGYLPNEIAATNPAYYVNNSDGSAVAGDSETPIYDTQLDGFTVPITCSAAVTPGQPNHVKLAIADVGDTALDSVVMIEGGSFVSGAATSLDETADATVQYSDDFNVSATLTSDGQPLGGKDVGFGIGAATTGAKTDSVTGVAAATLPADVQPGEHTVTADFTGSPGYLPSSDQTSIQVLQEDCVLSYTGDTTGNAGQPVTLSAQFAEPAGDTTVGDLSGRTVSFELTDQANSNNTALETAVTDANGVATTTVTLGAGDWLLEPSFDGDFFYTPCSASAPDIVVSAPTATQLDLAPPGTAQYSDPLPVSATLSADGGVSGELVSFGLGSATTSGVTDAEGVATGTLPVDLPAGNDTVSAEFVAADGLAGSTDSESVTIAPEDCTLSYTGATTGVQGHSVVLSAVLGESDANLGDRSGKTVTFTYSDDSETQQSVTAVTNGSGVAQTSVNLPQGTWSVTPSFEGDSYYSYCGADATTVTVAPPVPQQQNLATTLALETPNGIGYDAEYSDPLEVSATLTSAGAVAGQAVTFTLGSATASATTNAQGVATAVLPVGVPAGPATVHAAFAAAAGYLGSSDDVPVAIGPETCTLPYTGAVSGVEGDKVTLAAAMGEVDDSLGDRAGKTVTFTLRHAGVQKSATAVTDASGVAVTAKKLDPGTWRVTPSFAGDGYYSACSGKSASLAVRPLLEPTDAQIVAVQDNVQYSDHVGVDISLTSVGVSAASAARPALRVHPAVSRVPGGSGIGGAPVEVSLGSSHTTVTTDSTGHAHASVKATDPAGDRTLHVDYPGNSSYGASHTSGTVHLKREDTTLTYDGDTSGTSDAATTVAAVLAEEDGSVGDLAGHVVTFALHQGGDSHNVSATTDGSGRAATGVTLPAGDWSVTPSFGGDGFYLPAHGGAASISIEDAATTNDTNGPDAGPSNDSTGGPATGPSGGGDETHVLGEKETRPTEPGAGGESGDHGGEGATGTEGEGAAGEHGSEGEHPLNTDQPTFVLSIPDVHQVSLASSAVLLNGLLALLMILMIAFPAELFNGTLKENYDEVRGWFGPITAFLHRIEATGIHGHPIARGVGGLFFVGLTGLVYGFVEPGFGFDRESAQLIIALTVGLVVITVLANESALLFGRLRYKQKGRLRMRPGALLVALGCVLLSRAANFEPGYVYGLVAGFTFSRELPRRQDGKVVLAWAGWLLALALAGWLTLAPVKDWALAHESQFWAPVAEELSAAVVVESLTILILALVPLSFLEGERIWKWRRTVWVGVYGIALFAFLHVVVHPEFGGRQTELPLFTWLGFFLGFGLFSVAFWGYFRFRKSRHPAEA